MELSTGGALNPICPHCGVESEYVDSARVYRGKSYGMIYDCRDCDAYVGVHRGTFTPLGTMADRETRIWRMRAHDAFDPLWKSGRIDRRAAYGYMQKIMGMSPEQAHIARFNAEDCQRLVTALNASQPVRSKPPKFSKRLDYSLPDCCHHIAPWEHCEHTRTA
jgi:hypothetical protein